MIKVIFADARLWRYVLRELAEFLESVGIRFSPDEGVRLKAMDPSHVMLVDLHIPSTAFDEYMVERESTLVIPLEPVAKVLMRARKSDKLMISSDGSKLILGLISKGEVQRTFVLPLLAGGFEEIPELSLEHSVHAKILGTALAVALSILEDVGGSVKIRAFSEGISFIASSELSEVEVPFTMASGMLVDYQPPRDVEEIANTYSMEYLSLATPIAKLADSVTISMGADLPCEITLDLMAGSKLKLYVAPRTE